MKIHFVLPFSGRKPVGGFKVVYEYANELSDRGHEVLITHTAGLYLGVNPNDRVHINLAKFFIFGMLKNYLPTKWFKLNPKVKTRWVPSLHPIFIPDSDVVVATSWETAEWISPLAPAKGKKIYLIQHLEDWIASSDRVFETWKSIKNKVVISKWLMQIANDLGEEVAYVPNGLDFSAFSIDIAPESREPQSILMLYHEQPFKGTVHGLNAIALVRQHFPDIRVTLFGATKPPLNFLPSWANFVLRPSPERLRALYNQNAIFVSPSLSEGWALPPAEAMQCGCATVLTKIGGHEYAIDNKTSLLSTPSDDELMAGNIVRLLEDQSLRINLAKNSAQEMSQYTWRRATDGLLSAMENGQSQAA